MKNVDIRHIVYKMIISNLSRYDLKDVIDTLDYRVEKYLNNSNLRLDYDKMSNRYKFLYKTTFELKRAMVLFKWGLSVMSGEPIDIFKKSMFFGSVEDNFVENFSLDIDDLFNGIIITVPYDSYIEMYNTLYPLYDEDLLIIMCNINVINIYFSKINVDINSVEFDKETLNKKLNYYYGKYIV